jgi:hypothetical protein
LLARSYGDLAGQIFNCDEVGFATAVASPKVLEIREAGMYMTYRMDVEERISQSLWEDRQQVQVDFKFTYCPVSF